jgi:hypothetical protein
MTKEEKYEKYKLIAKKGDIGLWHGHALISKIIQVSDRAKNEDTNKYEGAYHNHASINTHILPRIEILDANADGVNPHYFGSELNYYKDFDILRFKNKTDAEIQEAIIKAMDRSIRGIKYDFFALPRILWNRNAARWFKWLGIKERPYKKNNKDYCSEFVRSVSLLLGVKCYDTGKDITPEDLHRLADHAEIELITDFKCDK